MIMGLKNVTIDMVCYIMCVFRLRVVMITSVGAGVPDGAGVGAYVGTGRVKAHINTPRKVIPSQKKAIRYGNIISL